MKNINSRRWLGLLFILLVAPTTSNAASIFIDAANITDRVVFNFGQFEGGFSINGSTPMVTGGSVFDAGTQINFTGQWVDLGAATPFSSTVYWIDPNTPSAIEQILQWTITPSGTSDLATISGFFQFKGLGTLPAGTTPPDLIVDLPDHGQLVSFNFSAAFLSGQIINQTQSPVPVPAAAWLFGTALIGFVGYSRRKKIS